MEYVKLAKVSDFASCRILSYSVMARRIAIVRERDGTFYATEIACKHQNADLTEGHFSGDVVTCARHGWKYNIKSGECLNENSAPLRRYGLKIEGEDILVSLTPVA